MAENGELFDYVKVGGSLSEPVIKNYIKQLLFAVSSIHKEEVCHRDLKLQNLVLDSDFNLQVIDFGLACNLSGYEDSGFCHNSERMGTLSHMAPETLMNYN